MEAADAGRRARSTPTVDEILKILSASHVLDTLDITDGDLESARKDSDLLETLTITYELLMTFDDAGVLDTFFRLPKGDQADFLRWIGSTDDKPTRDHRAETFIGALRAAPLPSPAPSREARDSHA